MDISPPELLRAIRWLQERIVFWTMGVALIAIILSTITITWNISRLYTMNNRIVMIEHDQKLNLALTLKLQAALEANNVTLSKKSSD